MSLLLAARNRDLSGLKQAIETIDPNIDIEIWPGVRNANRVQFAVAWNQPKHLFQAFPNLKAVSSLGAGVEHLLADESIPPGATLTRMVLPSLSDQISDYVLMAALNIINHSHLYFLQQTRAEWKPQKPFLKKNMRIGIMGLGELGTATAKKMAANGFCVSGWSRSKKYIENVKTYSENQLGDFLSAVNILACLLPLTNKTEEIIDLDIFKNLKQPAFFINAGRGGHLVDEDLIYALDTGLIQHAVLDVFSREPLPESHPFWNRKQITITPHMAALTDDKEAAQLIVENYKRLLSGMELLYPVDRHAEY